MTRHYLALFAMSFALNGCNQSNPMTDASMGTDAPADAGADALLLDAGATDAAIEDTGVNDGVAETSPADASPPDSAVSQPDASDTGPRTLADRCDALCAYAATTCPRDGSGCGCPVVLEGQPCVAEASALIGCMEENPGVVCGVAAESCRTSADAFATCISR